MLLKIFVIWQRSKHYKAAMIHTKEFDKVAENVMIHNTTEKTTPEFRIYMILRAFAFSTF